MVAGAIADYFAIPGHTAIADGNITIPASGTNTYTISATDPNTAITITVTDQSGRCPADYQGGSPDWDGANVYTKVVTN